MQISFVMLIFLLFSDQISGGAKVSEGGKLPQEAPCGRKPVYGVLELKTAIKIPES